MSILFIIVAVAFTVAMTILMVRPFSASRDKQLSFELLDEEERKIEALVSRKVALIQSLRDIEYDYKLDKISREDYERFKKSCERQAVGVMRKLEQLHGEDRDWDEVIDRALDERVDESIRSRNSTTQPEASTPSSSGDSDIESATGDASLTCGSCGQPLAPDDRFCSRCGSAVDASAGPDDELLDDPDGLSSSSASSEVAW